MATGTAAGHHDTAAGQCQRAAACSERDGAAVLARAAGVRIDTRARSDLHARAAANVDRTVRRQLLPLGGDEPPVGTLAHVALELELFEYRFRAQCFGLG